MKNELDLVSQTYMDCYPLLGMYDLLYQQVLAEGSNTTNFHEFEHTASLATPKTSFIPAPNNDTTYSKAWLDLRTCPVLIETPDTNGRYYCIQLLDMFSETVANLGKRVHGTNAHTFMIMQRDWKGEIPPNVIPIAVDSYYALAFLRILIQEESSLEEVKALQQQFHILGVIDESVCYPISQSQSERAFFQTMQEVLPIIAPSYMVELEKNAVKEVLACDDSTLVLGVQDAKAKIEEGGLTFGEEVHQWRIAKENMGRYGKHHLQRAVVWYKGALANVPEESLYPSTFQDETGALLEGTHAYTITFTKEEIPPVSQFWSMTMYLFHNGLLVENPIQRYSLGDRSDLHYEEDGSLTIYIQHDQPKSAKEQANWLPCPKGKFYITLRLYGPTNRVLSGEWKPPYVKRGEER